MSELRKKLRLTGDEIYLEQRGHSNSTKGRVKNAVPNEVS